VIWWFGNIFDEYTKGEHYSVPTSQIEKGTLFILVSGLLLFARLGNVIRISICIYHAHGLRKVIARDGCPLN
jgi:hypothetical protein